MKKFALVLLALLVAGSAFAEKVPVGDVTPNVIGTLDPNRDALISFTDLFLLGLEFVLVDPDPAVGSVNSAFGDFVMNEDGTGFTWCSDLAVIFASADFPDPAATVLLKIGGDFVDFGETFEFAWPEGRTSTAGPGGGNVDFGQNIDVTGLFLFLGNGYTSTEGNSWTGEITLFGDVVADEDSSFGSVKALFR